jgi:transposase
MKPLFSANDLLAQEMPAVIRTELDEHIDVHPTRIPEWKQQLPESVPDAFVKTSNAKTADPDLKVPHAKNGQLKLESDFLEGALTKTGLPSSKK